MDWKAIVNLTQSVINSIQNTAVFCMKEVRRISKQTFSVKITNPQDRVEVSGVVKVSNQKPLEDQIRNIALAVRELKKPLAALKKIEVSNMVAPTKIPDFPEFPKGFKVTNMTEFIKAVEDICDDIKKLKFEPKINIPAPVVNVPEQKAPVVNVPAPVVNVQAPVVNIEKPDLSDIHAIIEFLEKISSSKPLAVRLSDGRKFYKALEKMAEIYAGTEFSAFMTPTGDGGRGVLNKYNELRVTVNDTWDANDIEKVDANLTYFGEETIDGAWRVRRVTKSGTLTALRHATLVNNPGIESYEEAWIQRATLEYGYAREL